MPSAVQDSATSQVAGMSFSSICTVWQAMSSR
jgi:hypothetical protein